MCGGRIQVKVYGAKELVPAFEVFDAVSRGTAEMGHGAAYYWKGKNEAAQFFSTVPFGLTAQEMNGWIYHGGGQALWEELYDQFGLVPAPAGNTGVQMGGWFNKEINCLADLKGLKMRIPGLGGEVLRRAGGTPVNLPGGELFTSLQSGTIDATEWVGPYNDLAFGLYKAAKYYYYPGFHEPGTFLEAMINQKALESLPEDLQAIVMNACRWSTRTCWPSILRATRRRWRVWSKSTRWNCAASRTRYWPSCVRCPSKWWPSWRPRTSSAGACTTPTTASCSPPAGGARSRSAPI